jgi:Pyruvate/2-oxoacid:ferredoxin oxidoreductase delta subunit
MNGAVSRRELFSNLLAPFTRRERDGFESKSSPASSLFAQTDHGRTLRPPNSAPLQAIIQGRFCLAYQSFCSTCSERCPVPNAIIVENGIPRVNASACNGCGVCQEICPAPRNAVLMLPKKIS